MFRILIPGAYGLTPVSTAPAWRIHWNSRGVKRIRYPLPLRQRLRRQRADLSHAMALEGLLYGSGREGCLQNDKAGQPIYSGSAGLFEEWKFRVSAKWDALAGLKA